MRSEAKHLPRSDLRAVEQSEPIRSFPSVATEAVGGFIADGAGGGQTATTPAKGKKSALAVRR